MPFHDYTPPKYTGPSYEDVSKMRKAHVHPASFLLYKEPLMITHGSMQYLYDHTGRRYLDLFAGVSTSGMGHCHPRITSKMKE
jgi:alanine-glyoxylate transaminase/(R)-3-amino-2-methylpropionate-pyruvate transaminase